MEEETSRNGTDETECHYSPKLIDAPPKDTIDRSSKNSAMRGNIRYVFPDEILNPGNVNVAQAYSSSPIPEQEHQAEDGGSRRSSERFEVAQEALSEDEMMGEGAAGPQSESYGDQEDEDEFETRELDVGEARDIAARALATVPDEDVTPLPSSTPLLHVQKQERPPAPKSSPYLISRPHSQARSPLQSPCVRTLIPATPPPGGYWTPSSTEGEKNTPMCPPCRTGKKGRCFGGLPCDRCRDKGYSRERCEGSLVFRFSPRRKRGEGKERSVRNSPVDSGRWKRDAFGRFA